MKLPCALILALAAGACSQAASTSRPDVASASSPATATAQQLSTPAGQAEQAAAMGAASASTATVSAAPPSSPAGAPPGPTQAASDTARSNDFAARLYRAVTKQHQGNAFLSPTSLRLALGMMYAGALGGTATEMAQTLGFEADAAQVARAAQVELVGWAALSTPELELHLTSRLWADQSTPIERSYQAEILQGWAAGIEPVDFQRAAEASRRHINGWVKDETQGKIPELLPQGAVNADSRLLITNAIYFNGIWRYPFEARKTMAQPFFVQGADPGVEVPVMHQLHAFPYAEIHGAKLALLPYGTSSVGLVIVLPDAHNGLAAVEEKLSGAELASWGSALAGRPRYLELSLPRFEMSSGGSMRTSLEALGMKRAFTNGAELGLMTAKAALKVTDVVHKTYVRVDERGTEAAAATGAPMGLKSMPPPPMPFVVDHPFLFYLWDTTGGHVLFVGRVLDPRAK